MEGGELNVEKDSKISLDGRVAVIVRSVGLLA